MHKLRIDLRLNPTKRLLLEFLATQITDLFGLNYDALIDALTSYKEPFIIELLNISSFENQKELLEIFEIIQTQNNNIQIH